MIVPSVLEIARAVRERGGRALVVGGYVRDQLLGIDSKDMDVEVYGLSMAELEELLRRFGEVIAVGRSFGVLRVKGLPVDFSLPRRDIKTAAGHRGFAVVCEQELSFVEAARRRDLTINSMGLDPVSGEILDPHGGRQDLAAKRLKATDPKSFSEDALRGLRVAQFAARFDMRPDDELVHLCADLDLSELSAERLFEEFRKLLLKGKRPSVGFEVLRITKLVRFFPELAALIGVPQDPTWHPEGDVWIHTMMVLDQAAALRDGGPDDLALLFGALCHDFGKPLTTREEEGRVRSLSHERLSGEAALLFLTRLRAPKELIARVRVLVTHHLAPALFVEQGATDRAYRRLARKLQEGGASMSLLARLARADHLGRGGVRDASVIDTFAARARELFVETQAPRDVVLGRHLLARGLRPGPQFSEILDRCRELQEETGWQDADKILDTVLGQRSG